MAQLKTNKEHIFVCFGASDVLSLSKSILDYLDRQNSYHLMLGQGCNLKYFHEVKRKFHQLKLKGNVYFHSQKFFHIMSQCQYAILSASTIVYEASVFDLNFFSKSVKNNLC